MNKIRQLALLAATLVMQAATVGAANVLYVYSLNGGTMQSAALETVQQITFSGDNILLKTTDGNENVYLLANVGKITFENPIVTNVDDKTITDLQIKVYSPESGIVAIESPSEITAIAIYGISGAKLLASKPLATTATISIGNLPAGVYVLQVETTQGTITQKFIKH
jgi:hypothetical protein